MAAKKKEIKDKKVTLTKDISKKLLGLMGAKAKVDTSFDKENDAVKVDIDATRETGLLIGHRGETLNAMQSVIGMILRQKIGEWVRVIVNIGDWRAKQEEYLKTLARQAADRAKLSGEPQTLYNLTPGQRRVIHLSLAEDSEIETESQGEETERYLIVKAKK